MSATLYLMMAATQFDDTCNIIWFSTTSCDVCNTIWCCLQHIQRYNSSGFNLNSGVFQLLFHVQKYRQMGFFHIFEAFQVFWTAMSFISDNLMIAATSYLMIPSTFDDTHNHYYMFSTSFSIWNMFHNASNIICYHFHTIVWLQTFTKWCCCHHQIMLQKWSALLLFFF